MTAKKMDKKEIMEPDKLQSITQQVIEFIIAHKKPFFVASGVAVSLIVIIAAIFLSAIYYEHQAEKKYAEAAAISSDFFSKNAGDRLTRTTEIYNQVITLYPRSDAAVLAYFSLGHAYFEMNEIDKAIDSYRMFIEKSSKDNALASLAYYGLGYCYERKEDFENALQAFRDSEKLMSGDTFKAINLQNLARTLEKMNNTKEALQYYKEALKSVDDPFLILIIKSRIAVLS